MSDQDDNELTVNKIGARMVISDELAMEYGLIPDTRPPAPPPARAPWWRRARFTLGWTVFRARRRVGLWIAGVDPDYYD